MSTSSNNREQSNSSPYKIDTPQTVNSVPDYSSVLGDTYKLGYESGQAKQPRGSDSSMFSAATKNAHYSIFNDYNVISLNKGNYPLTDYDKESNADIYKFATALDLIDNPRGASIFMPRDFLLCARYGLPINRMITLRRFPFPIGDNIFEKNESLNAATEPDVARMITYMDQDINKMSDLLKFSYRLAWRELTAATEDAGSSINGNQTGVNGWMENMAKLLDDGTLSSQAVQGEYQLRMNPLNDQNKVFGPVDSIARTWIRGIGLTNEMQFTIVFDYELRSINGMNQKTLFIDLLSNILACTFNDGRFWGGARIWVGGRPSPFMRKLAFLNQKNAEDLLNASGIAVKEAVRKLSTPQGALETLRTVVTNGLNLALGKLLDKVGRPSTMVLNSILKGDNIGEWHLTIGNPLNPIMSIGNLRLTNTEIEFGDRLGYDDFPTSIKVTCTLEQGLDRDRAGLESIFNQGFSRTYWTPTSVLKREYSFKSENESQKRKSAFGEFDDSSVIRAAEMQTEYQRADESSSFEIGINKNQIVTETPKQPSVTWNNQQNSNSEINVDTDTSPNIEQ